MMTSAAVTSAANAGVRARCAAAMLAEADDLFAMRLWINES